MTDEYVVNIKQTIIEDGFAENDFSTFAFQDKEIALAFAKLLDKCSDPCRVRVHSYIGEEVIKIYDNNEL